MNTNFLIIMADEHSRKICGAYGNRIVHTPNIDRLAARGTRFTKAYTPCPICVPARAAFATGLPVHRTGHWDNAFGYDGAPESWAHELARMGRDVVSIGKLHYKDADTDAGFNKIIEPMYLHDGIGDVLGSVRDPLPVREVSRRMAERIGPGETAYTAYDRRVTQAAVDWIADKGQELARKPWTAFVSLVSPHFPLIAPQEFYERYAELELAPTKPRSGPDHPWLEAFRECFVYDNFDAEKTRIALASYYALTSFADDNVGRVLAALEESGMSGETVVLYISDHGENAGERGLWGKSVMYEESVGIPMIMAGPGVPSGRTCGTPVSLLDVYPTAISLGSTGDWGTTLLDLANGRDDPQRTVFSEYHAAGAVSAAYMVRNGRWKYIHYVGFPPQLFDLEQDPEEEHDLGRSSAHADVLAELDKTLRSICDPEVVDQQAKADQYRLVMRHGGRDAVIERGSFGATPAPGPRQPGA